MLEKLKHYGFDWNSFGQKGISDIFSSIESRKSAFSKGIEEFDEII